MFSKLTKKEYQHCIDVYLENIVPYLIDYTFVFIEKETNFLFYYLSNSLLLITTQV